MPDLKILGRKNSVNVQKVMWCLDELNIAATREDYGGAFGGNRTEDYLSMNPNGKVPTMIDGDFILWESQAIVRYLAENYASAPFFPNALNERYLCHQWMDFYIAELHPAMTTIFWTLIRTAPADRDNIALEKAINIANLAWKIVDKHLSQSEYMVGNTFTFGDIPLGCAAYRWHNLEITRDDLPHLKRWYQELTNRPSFQKHVMLPLT
jgi:glutathione S-transferase